MGVTEKNFEIIKEYPVEHFFNAILYKNGIIEIIWDKSIEEIQVIHLKKMQEAVFVLGEGKKMPLHFSVHEFLGINSDARKYASSKEGVKYTLATSVIVDNIAKKLLLNFFIKVNKPIVPTRGFTNKVDSFHWLEHIKDNDQ